MAKRADITPELCRQLLRYEPETGKLFWLPRTESMFVDRRAFLIWMARFCDRPALANVSDQGYYNGAIYGVHMKAHRVIWALVYGEWPEQVDHINGNRLDNRLTNLRAADNSLNGKNKGVCRRNTSGATGVVRSECGRKWRAQIGSGGRIYALGTFETFEAAKAARKEAEQRFRFHPNHGDASRRPANS